MRFIFIIIFISFSSKGQNLYFPGKLWEEKSPESQGIDIKKLDKAIEFAISNENSVDKDLRISIIKSFGREPGYKIKGPTKKRGDSNGLIIKNGYIIGKWGDTKRVDMTFSVTKIKKTKCIIKNSLNHKKKSSKFLTSINLITSININFESVLSKSSHVRIVFFLGFLTELTNTVNVVSFLKFFEL